MFYMKDELLLSFGNYLKLSRIKKDVTLRSISKKTKIDISTLHNLEKGTIKKINPIMLITLADYYNTNVIVFYKMLGLINDNLINEYKNITSGKENDFSIPLYNNIFDIDNFNKKITRKINIPFAENSSRNFFSFQHVNNCIFIFCYTDTLKNNDLGIFKFKDDYIIARYKEKSNFLVLIDYFQNSNMYIEEKNQIKIIGKITYRIEKN